MTETTTPAGVYTAPSTVIGIPVPPGATVRLGAPLALTFSDPCFHAGEIFTVALNGTPVRITADVDGTSRTVLHPGTDREHVLRTADDYRRAFPGGDDERFGLPLGTCIEEENNWFDLYLEPLNSQMDSLHLNRVSYTMADALVLAWEELAAFGEWAGLWRPGATRAEYDRAIAAERDGNWIAGLAVDTSVYTPEDIAVVRALTPRTIAIP